MYVFTDLLQSCIFDINLFNEGFRAYGNKLNFSKGWERMKDNWEKKIIEKGKILKNPLKEKQMNLPSRCYILDVRSECP